MGRSGFKENLYAFVTGVGNHIVGWKRIYPCTIQQVGGSVYEYGVCIADSRQTALRDGIIYGPLTVAEFK